ncbi:MAG: helix-turn-helix domain-containing protein [Candidatus Paceibacterota bacterium]|jgi:hypothetical protein
MEKLKKVLSLSEASKISGYHPDYLSALIRKGELRGEKTGGTWFTTEDDVRDYIFKQKVRHNRPAFFDFLSQKRTQNIVIYSGIIFCLISLLGFYFYGINHKNFTPEAKKTLSPDTEAIKEIKTEINQ